MGRCKERRSFHRVDTPGGEALCRGQNFGDDYVLLDLSQGGARLHWGRPMAIGTKVRLTLLTGTLGIVEVDGRVAHHGPDGRSMGIAFGDVSAEVAEKLDDLVVDAWLDDFSASSFTVEEA